MRSSKRCLLLCISLILVILFVFRYIHQSGLEEEEEILADNPSEFEEDDDRRYDRISESHHPLQTIDQIRTLLQLQNNSTETKDRPKAYQHLLDYIKNPADRLSPFDFSECRMSNCFDFSRCRDSGPLKVHIVPAAKLRNLNTTLGESNLIHQNILKIIRESAHYEPIAEKACIFVPEIDTLDRDPLSQSFRSYQSDLFDRINRYGMNYLVFNLYSGSWPYYKENDFAGLQFRAAILVKASNSISHHRPRFDISLPLFSYQHPLSQDTEWQKSSSTQLSSSNDSRTYFLTFKGKRYVYGSGSDTRNNLYHLNNERDIIMLTTCRHGKRWRQSSDVRCSEEESNYDKHDFVDLMKESSFCLTPRGRRLGSFRFLEALSYGCIPVILSDGWVKPFDEIIDWSCATVQFDESLLFQVPDMLRDVSPRTVTSMRQNCLKFYEKYFSTTQKIILTSLSILERRIKNHIERIG